MLPKPVLFIVRPPLPVSKSMPQLPQTRNWLISSTRGFDVWLAMLLICKLGNTPPSPICSEPPLIMSVGDRGVPGMTVEVMLRLPLLPSAGPPSVSFPLPLLIRAPSKEEMAPEKEKLELSLPTSSNELPMVTMPAPVRGPALLTVFHGIPKGMEEL